MRYSKQERLGWLTLAATGLMLAAPAVADQPKTERKEVRTVIIDHDGKGPAGAAVDGERLAMDCPGKKVEVDAAPAGTAAKTEVAKIVICSKGGSNAEAATGLERALTRVAGDPEMDPATKAELTARLRAKIAELRAAK